MRKTVFLLNKFSDLRYANQPPPNHDAGILGYYRNANLTEWQSFFYDEFFYTQGHTIDQTLIKYCQNNKPLMIVLPYYHYIPGTPSDETIRALASIAPVVLAWYDSVNVGDQQCLFRLSTLPVYHIALDRETISPFINENRTIRLWFATDEDIYKPDPSVNKDIDVSFVGEVDYPQRLAYITEAAKNEIIINCPSTTQRLSVEDCVKYWQRSKITINFSKAKYVNLDQSKHRIYEVMQCGTFLLESDNAEIMNFFEPMIDYVPFSTPKDFIEKIQYYLNNAEQRERIAQGGWFKKTNKYNSKAFWETVFNKVGVKWT